MIGLVGLGDAGPLHGRVWIAERMAGRLERAEAGGTLADDQKLDQPAMAEWMALGWRERAVGGHSLKPGLYWLPSLCEASVAGGRGASGESAGSGRPRYRR